MSERAKRAPRGASENPHTAVPKADLELLD